MTDRQQAVATVHAIAGTLANREQAVALERAMVVLAAEPTLPDDPLDRAEAAAADAERLLPGRPDLAWLRAQTYALLAAAATPTTWVTNLPRAEISTLDPDGPEQVEPTLAARSSAADGVPVELPATLPRRARATGPGRAVKDAPQA